jgi:curli biogenesis system outer membrane secretion channel CsgG
MKHAVSGFLLALSMAIAPSPGFAQAKIRIAIWDIDNNAATTWWFWDQMGPAARNHIDTAFSENQALSSKFTVLERDKLALILKEQGLAATGAVDPQTAAKVGRLLGVKYILTGGIDKFAINTTRGGIGAIGVGGAMTTADATINIRVIDTTTAERIISIAETGQVKKGGGFVRGTSLSRDAEWGIASEAIEKVSKAIVAKLTTGDYLAKIGSAAGSAVAEGRIIKVDGNRAWINLGSASGLKVGDKFNIIAVGEALIDPDTGAKLGAEEKQTGAGEVSEVQEKFAIMTITGTAKAKDTIRKQ